MAPCAARRLRSFFLLHCSVLFSLPGASFAFSYLREITDVLPSFLISPAQLPAENIPAEIARYQGHALQLRNALESGTLHNLRFQGVPSQFQ